MVAAAGGQRHPATAYCAAVPDLDPTDAAVLAEAAALALATGRRIVDAAPLEAACLARGIGHDGWFASMERLMGQGLLRMRTSPPSAVQLISVSERGLIAHLEASRPDLGAVEERLWAVVKDAPAREPLAFHEMLGEPALLVETLLDRWVSRRRVVYSKAPGRRFRIYRILQP